MERCVIIGASYDNKFNIDDLIREDDYIICADGGYDIAEKFNIKTDLLIGDFDSLNSDIKGKISKIKLPCEKDDTDLMFCAKKAVNLGYKEVLILGATGKRVDHTLGNLSVLMYLSERNIKAYIVDRYSEIHMLTEGEYAIIGRKGDTVSAIPFGCSECTVSYEGLKYDMKKEKIFSDIPLGISNEVKSNQAKIHLHNGKILIVFDCSNTK